MRIILFGGTFDPVHRGHTEILARADARVNAEKIIVMPAYIAPHKQGLGLSAAEHRLAMLRAVFEGFGKVHVDDREILRGGVSYTVDTVRELYESEGSGLELYVLIGWDNVRIFRTWKSWETLLNLCKFIVVPRTDGASGEADEAILRRMEILEGPLLPCASSEIRRRIGDEAYLRRCLHPVTLDYIRQKGLYKEYE